MFIFITHTDFRIPHSEQPSKMSPRSHERRRRKAPYDGLRLGYGFQHVTAGRGSDHRRRSPLKTVRKRLMSPKTPPPPPPRSPSTGGRTSPRTPSTGGRRTSPTRRSPVRRLVRSPRTPSTRGRTSPKSGLRAITLWKRILSEVCAAHGKPYHIPSKNSQIYKETKQRFAAQYYN